MKRQTRRLCCLVNRVATCAFCKQPLCENHVGGGVPLTTYDTEGQVIANFIQLCKKHYTWFEYQKSLMPPHYDFTHILHNIIHGHG